MCAVSNGLAAYSQTSEGPSIIPVTSSFYMFYISCTAAARISALQRLYVIHIATHNSIGTGEDVQIHQLIELTALYRNMLHLLYLRPGDSEEAAGAWEVAVKNTPGTSIISLSRHALGTALDECSGNFIDL
ncbi:Thiamin diphosphate-binding protein [Lepidopterella palustris CBS 459.81]|uniref:Thiamin diphosphate-binding protein n=1 Tax=Lepidopterella palustris CBS 459.81 TaxID=1314670 RepID=A0A8E2EG04_9PEZI|nr:Thiamin diphosphate-binding protein [Lepidopterella palustris CBS 459.81]